MTTILPLLPGTPIRAPLDDEAGLGALRTRRGNLPLEAVDVHARLAGLHASVELRQAFTNPYAEPLEATYVFPLPDRAAVTGFRMELGERVVDGVLQERAAARAAYDRALAEGRRASIAEEERPGVFTMRVGNLLPGETATVRLTLAGPLPYEDGEATFRLPLVVAPRYIPGAPLPDAPVGEGTSLDTDAVPDASRITPPVLLPGFPNPVRLTLAVEVDPAGLPVGELRSSLHAVCEQQRDGVRVVTVAAGERIDRDFVLRLAIHPDALTTALVTSPDADGAGGSFALTLVPPAGSGTGRPRDVVFVLDRSGSMAGWKMVAARRAAARMVDTLCGGDRFAVLAFDNLVETPPAGTALAPASDRNRFRAVEFLAGLQARGGTELAGPLGTALDGLRDGDGSRERVLVLVTDGQVGNEDQIVRLVAGRVRGVRVFTVGIDTAVNAGFLRRLAALGGGACELVESEDRLDAVMERLHRRIAAPVLTDLRIADAGLGIEPGSVAPARLPDLFAGAPLVVTGRYRASLSERVEPAGGPSGKVELAGRRAGRPWTATVPAAGAADPALTPIWARARLRDLEDRYAAASAPDEALERQIVATSLRFGVLCRFTAFVAVDTQVAGDGSRIRRVIQPVEAPQGWDMFAAQPVLLARLPGLGGAAPMAAAAGGGQRLAFRPAAARGSMLPRRRQAPSAPLAGTELAPYRERARVLRDGLGAAVEVAERARRLARLAEELAVLVADLRSVGADAHELAPLEELLGDLEGQVALEPPVAGLEGQPAPGPAVAGPAVAGLWERALAVLAAFAEAGVPATGPGPAPPPAGAGPEPDGAPPNPAVGGRPPAGPRPAVRRAFWKRAD